MALWPQRATPGVFSEPTTGTWLWRKAATMGTFRGFRCSKANPSGGTNERKATRGSRRCRPGNRGGRLFPVRHANAGAGRQHRPAQTDVRCRCGRWRGPLPRGGLPRFGADVARRVMHDWRGGYRAHTGNAPAYAGKAALAQQVHELTKYPFGEPPHLVLSIRECAFLSRRAAHDHGAGAPRARLANR